MFEVSAKITSALPAWTAKANPCDQKSNLMVKLGKPINSIKQNCMEFAKASACEYARLEVSLSVHAAKGSNVSSKAFIIHPPLLRIV